MPPQTRLTSSAIDDVDLRLSRVEEKLTRIDDRFFHVDKQIAGLSDRLQDSEIKSGDRFDKMSNQMEELLLLFKTLKPSDSSTAVAPQPLPHAIASPNIQNSAQESQSGMKSPVQIQYSQPSLPLQKNSDDIYEVVQKQLDELLHLVRIRYPSIQQHTADSNVEEEILSSPNPEVCVSTTVPVIQTEDRISLDVERQQPVWVIPSPLAPSPKLGTFDVVPNSQVCNITTSSPIVPKSRQDNDSSRLALVVSKRETFLKKFESPIFDGSDDHTRLYLVERFLDHGKYGNFEIFLLVTLNLSRNVIRCFGWEISRAPFKDWQDFKSKFLLGFGQGRIRLKIWLSVNKIAAIQKENIECRIEVNRDLSSDPMEEDLDPTRHIDENIYIVIRDLMGSSSTSSVSKTLHAYLSIGEQFYQDSQQLVEKISCFETHIHRPYFYVNVWDTNQLDSWHAYLCFVTTSWDFDWAVKLLEELISFLMMQVGSRQVDLLDPIIDKETSHGADSFEGMSAEDKEKISNLYMEFIDLSGTVHDMRKALDSYYWDLDLEGLIQVLSNAKQFEDSKSIEYYKKTVSNFSLDLRDAQAYVYLVNVLAPDHCDPATIDVKDPLQRAELVLSHAEKMDCKRYLTANEIIEGSPTLNFAFVAQVFHKRNSLSMDVKYSFAEMMIEDVQTWRDERVLLLDNEDHKSDAKEKLVLQLKWMMQFPAFKLVGKLVRNAGVVDMTRKAFVRQRHKTKEIGAEPMMLKQSGVVK